MSEMLFKKTEVKRDFSKTNKLIYGFPKTGKTTLCSHMKDLSGKEPLFIMTEDGSGELEIYSQRVTSWEGFTQLVKHVIIPKKKEIIEQHSCIVIDLISDIDEWSGRFVEKENKISHLSDLEYGKGWCEQEKVLKDIFLPLLNVLPITFIAHSTEKEIIWQGEKIKLQAPLLSKRALNFINGKVDLIAFILPASKMNENSQLVIEPSIGHIAGSRYKSIIGTYEIDNADMSKTYAAIQTSFNKEKKK